MQTYKFGNRELKRPTHFTATPESEAFKKEVTTESGCHTKENYHRNPIRYGTSKK